MPPWTITKAWQLVGVSVSPSHALLAERGLAEVVWVAALAQIQIWVVVGCNYLGIIDIFETAVSRCSVLVTCFTFLILFVLLFSLSFHSRLLTLGIVVYVANTEPFSWFFDRADALFVQVHEHMVLLDGASASDADTAHHAGCVIDHPGHLRLRITIPLVEFLETALDANDIPGTSCADIVSDGGRSLLFRWLFHICQLGCLFLESLGWLIKACLGSESHLCLGGVWDHHVFLEVAELTFTEARHVAGLSSLQKLASLLLDNAVDVVILRPLAIDAVTIIVVELLDLHLLFLLFLFVLFHGRAAADAARIHGLGWVEWWVLLLYLLLGL